MFPPLYKNSKSHWNKTIHGLIYNALKVSKVKGEAGAYNKIFSSFSWKWTRVYLMSAPPLIEPNV